MDSVNFMELVLTEHTRNCVLNAQQNQLFADDVILLPFLAIQWLMRKNVSTYCPYFYFPANVRKMVLSEAWFIYVTVSAIKIRDIKTLILFIYIYIKKK